MTNFELCQVLLVDDSNYPAWLVLVPQQNGLTVSLLCLKNSFFLQLNYIALSQTALVHVPTQEIIDLPERDQHLLWKEVARASRALKTCFSQAPQQGTQYKLNIASIGNMVGGHCHAFTWFTQRDGDCTDRRSSVCGCCLLARSHSCTSTSHSAALPIQLGRDPAMAPWPQKLSCPWRGMSYCRNCVLSFSGPMMPTLGICNYEFLVLLCNIWCRTHHCMIKEITGATPF